MADEYCIMERTPFPGYWQPLHTCFLQQGEYRARINRTHYHERARRIGAYPHEVFLYSWEDANRIIAALQVQRGAEYYLIKFPG